MRFERGAWVITDRGSRNGTFVDGERITNEVRAHGTAGRAHRPHGVPARPRGRGYADALADAGEHVIGPELARLYAR